MSPTRAVAGAVATVALIALLVGCGRGDRNTQAVATDHVAMRDAAFDPVHAQIPAGSTMTWTNRDPFGHDVAFEGGSRSPVLDQGETYQQTFPDPGTFDYVCTLHSGMVGRVTVMAA